MTWKQFKEWVAAQDVPDEATIDYIDFSGFLQTPFVRQNENSEGIKISVSIIER